MSTTEYIATVYGRGAMTKAHTSLVEAFDWVRSCVTHGAWSYDRGRVMLGETLLVEYTRETTTWHADGYTRWAYAREQEAR